MTADGVQEETRGGKDSMGPVTAIVLSGGAGNRFHGSYIPKQFVEIEGKPILAYCLDTYEALSMIDEIALVINERYEQLYYDICSTFGYLKVRRFIAGGSTRQESVACGLAAKSGVRVFRSLLPGGR